MLSSHWPEELLEFFSLVKEYIHIQVDCKEAFDKSVYTFEEDVFLSGFTPLSSIVIKSAHTKRTASEVLQFEGRLLSIDSVESNFLDNENRFKAEEFLSNTSSSGFTPEENNTTELGEEESNSMGIPVEKENGDIERIQSNKEGKADLKEMSTAIEKNNEDAVAEEEADRSEREDGNQSKSLANEDDSDDWEDQVIQLTRLKRQLEAKKQAKRFYNNRLVEILKDIDTTLYIEVRPKYLLPDTNCFIDCLENFKRIVTDYKHYVLVVPLTGKF